jgi:crotonobetainyl-CoA:carnitine CoA-transferase CaiB-like acyl-CoA transferase
MTITSTAPLAGLRGIVLTQAWAGTFATELLGLLGMEIVQIEARQRLDSWRGGYGGAVPKAIRENGTAIHPWNCNPLYNSVNLNKQAITLNLSHPDGVAIFKRLVPFADVVAENFSPRVMGNLGLDYAALTQIRPDVILLSMSAYGATGPYANIPGIGGTIEPMAGMSALLGYEDGPPLNSGQMYPDPVAGYYGAAAVLIALHHRERTGEGQHIDLSMQEANMTFIADALVEFSAGGRVRGRMGNHHSSIAPHNVYRCAGEDDWIALSAATDEEFARLCTVAGHPEWSADPRFADVASRKRNERDLDAAIATWTVTRDAAALEPALWQANVTAARVRNARDVLSTDHLWERGMLAEVTHGEAGRHAQMGAPWRMSRTPGGVTLPAPGLGEHSREVLARFLDIDDAEYERLVAQGVTGTGPPD